MTLKLDKLFFPQLPRDQRRRRMHALTIMSLGILASVGMVVAAIYLLNKR